jgi:hypothetical protein
LCPDFNFILKFQGPTKLEFATNKYEKNSKYAPYINKNSGLKAEVVENKQRSNDDTIFENALNMEEISGEPKEIADLTVKSD